MPMTASSAEWKVIWRSDKLRHWKERAMKIGDLRAGSMEVLEPRRLMRTYYTVTDLGTLGGAGSGATAVNDSGQIIGYSDTTGRSYHAFLYSPATGMKDLGTPRGYANSSALGINRAGQIVGFARNSDQDKEHAFFYSPQKGRSDERRVGK